MASKYLLVQNVSIDGTEQPLVDVRSRDGIIVEITPAALAATQETPAQDRIDARGGLILRPFAEPHSHPDKVYSRERIAQLEMPPIRDREDMMERQRRLKAQFTVEDVERRATRFLQDCAAEGIGVLAGQADIDSVTELRSIEGLLAARERSSDWVDLVVTAFPQEGIVADPRAEQLLREGLRMGADRVGGWPNNEPSHEASLEHLRTVFVLAEEFSVPIDINIDYFTDPTERLLEHLAEMTIAAGMQGRVNANHVGALETYSDDDAARVIGKAAAAGISVTVCPTNLAGTRPYRGVSRPLELLAAGVDVTIGIGNYEDNWEYLGTLDPLERARLSWHALALGRLPGEGIDAAWGLITSSARAAVGRPADPIVVGSPADFVVLSAGDRVQALRNEAASRWHVRGGTLVAQRIVETTLRY
ncbi:MULTISPECIES: amidohydrolase family protein [unclassified Leucobacter]|uniref:amidohydrolase family protein n=1 Tax=unclassified Leucobacter TaxID=2621730 RepID=UPI00165E6FB3|nr:MULTISPECIES: amidohydrolase family protein [unclassified Leucobacter]MBC9936542.1 amidohydrolase family protein [Leucobacter sp. cx-87]